LQPPLAQTQQAAGCHKQFPIRGNQVGHLLIPKNEPMEPQPTVQCVCHPLTTSFKLAPLNSQLQSTLPSTTAVPRGAALPTKM
jgi:hypothetical protein